MGEPFELCLSYSDVSNKCTDALHMLDYLCGQFGLDKLQRGIDFMFEALASDLNAVTQLEDKVVLENVGTALSQTRALNSAQIILEDFVQRASSVHHLECGDLSGFKLVQRLFKLASGNFIQTNALRSSYEEIKIQDPSTEVLLGQELLSKVRLLGTEAFAADEQRSKLLDAVQNLVDVLAEREDKWLEQQEAH